MALNSKIEWTDHTFNPWWGCTKVSSACANCYAETWAKRTGYKIWGERSPRRFLSESYWRQPYRWNQMARESGRAGRVFCASMADVFEWRADLNPWRKRLWNLIMETPNLDWLLLTKRPHLAMRLTPWSGPWPTNVWIGATVETQAWAEKRIPFLTEIPARVRFLSCEPLRGPINLEPWLQAELINWVIAGGESGPKARPSEPIWFRDLRDQCRRNQIPFHFKQWGDWAPIDAVSSKASPSSVLNDRRWSVQLGRFGKRISGRSLDGRTWDGIPHTQVGSNLNAQVIR